MPALGGLDKMQFCTSWKKKISHFSKQPAPSAFMGALFAMLKPASCTLLLATSKKTPCNLFSPAMGPQEQACSGRRALTR